MSDLGDRMIAPEDLTSGQADPTIDPVDPTIGRTRRLP